MDKIYKGDVQSSIKALDGLTDQDIADIKQSIIMNSIHYAKRQMTFFRSFADVNWANPEDSDKLSSLINEFLDR